MPLEEAGKINQRGVTRGQLGPLKYDCPCSTRLPLNLGLPASSAQRVQFKVKESKPLLPHLHSWPLGKPLGNFRGDSPCVALQRHVVLDHCMLEPKHSVTPSLLSRTRSLLVPSQKLRLRILFPGRREAQPLPAGEHASCVAQMTAKFTVSP